MDTLKGFKSIQEKYTRTLDLAEMDPLEGDVNNADDRRKMRERYLAKAIVNASKITHPAGAISIFAIGLISLNMDDAAVREVLSTSINAIKPYPTEIIAGAMAGVAASVKYFESLRSQDTSRRSQLSSLVGKSLFIDTGRSVIGGVDEVSNLLGNYVDYSLAGLNMYGSDIQATFELFKKKYNYLSLPSKYSMNEGLKVAIRANSLSDILNKNPSIAYSFDNLKHYYLKLKSELNLVETQLTDFCGDQMKEIKDSIKKCFKFINGMASKAFKLAVTISRLARSAAKELEKNHNERISNNIKRDHENAYSRALNYSSSEESTLIHTGMSLDDMDRLKDFVVNVLKIDLPEDGVEGVVSYNNNPYIGTTVKVFKGDVSSGSLSTSPEKEADWFSKAGKYLDKSRSPKKIEPANKVS